MWVKNNSLNKIILKKGDGEPIAFLFIIPKIVIASP